MDDDSSYLNGQLRQSVQRVCQLLTLSSRVDGTWNCSTISTLVSTFPVGMVGSIRGKGNELSAIGKWTMNHQHFCTFEPEQQEIKEFCLGPSHRYVGNGRMFLCNTLACSHT